MEYTAAQVQRAAGVADYRVAVHTEAGVVVALTAVQVIVAARHQIAGHAGVGIADLEIV